ncbi:MAG: XRE family transcriptional regulator [Rhodospirillaceae bacterium]|nr:MAG: XRE family transcriptional regulator [Rhodospirillaceae bacterium]
MRPSWQKVERARADLGLSQRKLAARIGVTQGHLSKILRGQIPDKHNILGKAMAVIAAPMQADGATDQLLESVRALALQSQEFRQFLYLAMQLASQAPTDAK